MSRRFPRSVVALLAFGAIALVASACVPPVVTPTVSAVVKAGDPLLEIDVLHAGDAPRFVDGNTTAAQTVTGVKVGSNDFEIFAGHTSGDCDEVFDKTPATSQGYAYVGDFERTVNVTTSGQVVQVPAVQVPTNDAIMTGHSTAPVGSPIMIDGVPTAPGTTQAEVTTCTTVAADGTFTLHAVPSNLSYMLFRYTAAKDLVVSPITIHTGTNTFYLGY
jgi:hypothetical protein